MNRTRWAGAAMAATALLTAGCGTTVKTGAASPNNSNLSLGGTNSPSPGAGQGATSTTATGAGGAVPQSGGLSSSGQAGSGSPSGSGPSGGPGPTISAPPTSKLTPANAPGVTAKYIYVGIPYSSQAAAGDSAIGAAGAAPSYDERSVFNSVIDYANAHGGFAGRQLVPLYYNVSLTENTDTQYEAACAYFTQDNKVMFLPGGDADNIFDACAQKAGTVALGVGAATEATVKKFPNVVDPDGIALDRIGSVTATGLFKGNYFTGKLGLVTWDSPAYQATVANGYLPTLGAHNIKPLDTVYISVPQQISALGDMTAQVSSAVTKFKAEGIDHVIIQDGPAGVWSGAGLTFEWMNQAKSQNYFPRYGENSGNAPGWSVLPADEQNNLLAIDDSDGDAQYDVGWHTNQARQKCFQIEANAGYPVNSSNQNNEGIAAGVCDDVFFVQQVINSLPVVSTANFVTAAQNLGYGFSPAVVYGSWLTPGRRDGGDMFRTEEYFSSCSCLKFQGVPYYVG